MPGPVFSATIVTYRPDVRLLERSLASLGTAIEFARAEGQLSEARVFVVDNGPGDDLGDLRLAASQIPASIAQVEVLGGHGNLGYGRANNLVLERLDSDFHLVMNPDVELEPEALAAALGAMSRDAGLGLVAPAAF